MFHVERDGEPVGLFVADHYARETKRGGAWMNSFVVQSRAARHPAGGAQHPEPHQARRRRADAADRRRGRHALPRVRPRPARAALATCAYPTFAGTGVPRDFVEYPSQVNEMWLRDPEILAATPATTRPVSRCPHDLRGPAEDAAPAFGEGFATTEYLAAALLDQAWHRLAPASGWTDVEAFEAAALAAAGMPAQLPPRYRSTYFNHVFAGGYSAGYYSYIWSEVLDADTVEWFGEHGGLRRQNGELFAEAAVPRRRGRPDGGLRAFRGRDPEIAPLLTRRGLAGVSFVETVNGRSRSR